MTEAQGRAALGLGLGRRSCGSQPTWGACSLKGKTRRPPPPLQRLQIPEMGIWKDPGQAVSRAEEGMGEGGKLRELCLEAVAQGLLA